MGKRLSPKAYVGSCLLGRVRQSSLIQVFISSPHNVLETVPTEQQTRDLSTQLAENGELPKYIIDLADSSVVQWFVLQLSS